jgi:hypothetical protein
VAASDWPFGFQSLTCGSIDWSTVNVDRAMIGLSWARAGPSWADLGWPRPDTWRALVLPRHLSGLWIGLGSIGLVYGGQTVGVHRARTWSAMDLVHTRPSPSWLTCTRCTVQRSCTLSFPLVLPSNAKPPATMSPPCCLEGSTVACSTSTATRGFQGHNSEV